MYVSMTGFSRSQIQTKWGTVVAELSSVNHRYQEISVRLPREFAGWEPWFHQNLRKTFRRGKVQLRMEVLWAQDFKTGRVNRDVLAAYCEEMSAARRALGFVAGFTGEAVEAGLARRGVNADFIRLPEGLTRINVKIFADQETQINGQGPQPDATELEEMLDTAINYEDFFSNAPELNENRNLIKGVICGVRVEDIEEPLMREIRYLDKLIDELAKGKSMEKILRK